MKVYYDRDANVGALRERRVAVIGYGSQGFAQSNNLKDSGVDVTVGLKADSPSRAKAEGAGLKVLPVAQAAAEADVVMILVPDEVASDVYAREVAESMTPGKYLSDSPTRRPSAAGAPGSSRPLSARRPRQTSSASRPCSAAA